MLSNYNFEVEKSKDGLEIFKIFKDEKNIYIGSKYRMEQKINDFINFNKEKIKEDTICVIFGIGSGATLSKICKVYDKNKILIFEPNKNVLEYVRKNKEKYNFIDENRVQLFDENKDRIISKLKENITQYNVEKVEYIYLLNYYKIYEKEVEKFNKVFTEVISDLAIERNTNLKFSRIWFNTIMSNFKYIVESMTINKFKNKYKDCPAIIVSAGPSLNKNIDELKKIDNDLMILTGGRTLKALLERYIQPHLLGVVDPVQETYDLVNGYIDKVNCPLLFYEGTNEKVVNQHNGKKIIFTQNNLVYELFNEDILNLGLGGSVAHTLTAMAVNMGCNPIIFIGQDLAYTDEKYHAEVAVNQFKTLDSNVSKNSDNIYVEDINGNKVRTSLVLDGFRRELEKIISDNPTTTFINATEGGAKIKGTKQMKLKEVIECYKSNKKILDLSLNSNTEDEINIVREKAIKVLQESINADKFIINKCKLALEEVKKLKLNMKIKNNNKIRENVRVLDKIDEDTRTKYKQLELLNSLIYPIVYSILNDSTAKTDSEIIDKNNKLYGSILEECEFALEFMQNVLRELTSN